LSDLSSSEGIRVYPAEDAPELTEWPDRLDLIGVGTLDPVAFTGVRRAILNRTHLFLETDADPVILPRRAFPEEVLFHLLQDEFLGFRSAEVQTVLVHDHLHLFHPHGPGLFRNVIVDALTQRMSVKRRLGKPR